jgi:hypothetical protein
MEGIEMALICYDVMCVTILPPTKFLFHHMPCYVTPLTSPSAY